MQKEKKKHLKSYDGLKNLWENIKQNNIQKEKRGKGSENLLEKIMAENFHNLVKKTGIQVQEAQIRVQEEFQITPRHCAHLLP